MSLSDTEVCLMVVADPVSASGVYVRVYWYHPIDELLIRRSWVDAPTFPFPTRVRFATKPSPVMVASPVLTGLLI